MGRQTGTFKTLAALSLVCMALGSVHAFSVFLDPLQSRFGLSRGAVSLVYSLTLVSLTAAVLLGPHIYGRLTPARFLGVSCIFAAFGVGLAAVSPGFGGVLVGYSLVFGIANGLGYGFSLQLSARIWPGREGLAMGIITAAYATGAAIAPLCFAIALRVSGLTFALAGLACVLVVVGMIVGLALRGTTALAPRKSTQQSAPNIALVPLWLSYGAAVTAGLMVIGHAAGIVGHRTPDVPLWIAPFVVALANLCGSLLGGRLADVVEPRHLVFSLSAVSAFALVGLAIPNGEAFQIFALALIGLTYGGTISVFPALIAKRYGPTMSPFVYGRVFTAWGAAGLFAPLAAGFFFDRFDSYGPALALAVAFAIGAAVLGYRVFSKENNLAKV